MQFTYKTKNDIFAFLHFRFIREWQTLSVRLLVATLLLTLSNTVTLAGESTERFERGLDAFRGGDLNAAITEWSAAAEDGNRDALFNLGLLFANGNGVKQDWDEAKTLFQKAGRRGSELAMFSLAIMYFNGQGVPKDLPMAHVWASLGADLRNETSRKLRDSIEKTMSKQELAFSHKTKQRCIDSNYDDC